jgi:Ca2+-transporting ATPase
MLIKLMPIFLLALLIGVSFWMLQPFVLTLLWALIISFVLFPLYKRFNQFIQNDMLSAAFFTSFITVVLIGLTFVIFHLIENEIKNAYILLSSNVVESSWQLPEKIRQIPHIGDYLQDNLNRLKNNHLSLTAQLMDWLKNSFGIFAQFFSHIGQRVIKFSFVLATVFFCFRDGELWLQQLKQFLRYFLGDVHSVYLQTASDTTRAVIYGLVLAALSQGFIAGIGYFVAGVKMPLLLAMLTALVALIPMGATLVWLPTALMLLIDNQLFAGVGLIIWGFLAVSTIDNVIRPLVICGASKIPFLVVMFGVFGGLSTFGTIGLFLGPVILSVLLAVWKNFIHSLNEKF